MVPAGADLCLKEQDQTSNHGENQMVRRVLGAQNTLAARSGASGKRANNCSQLFETRA